MPEDEKPFESQLKKPAQQFLAEAIEFMLAKGERKPEDFIRHFPPMKIMAEALKDEPKKRAGILVLAVGTKQKTAELKSAASAGEDLEIALKNADTTTEEIVALFQPDDRVQHCAASELWSYTHEGGWWKTPATDAEKHARAKNIMVYLVERALNHKLLKEGDVLDGITSRRLVQTLSEDVRVALLDASLKAGRAHKPFTDADTLKLIGVETIVEAVPLPEIWEGVMVPKIALAQKFEGLPKAVVAADETKEAAEGDSPKA